VPPEGKKYRAENHDDADFDKGGPVLEVGAFAGAPDVHSGDYGNHDDGEDRFSQGGERDDLCEVLREGASQGGDGAAGDDQEEAPAVEKSRDAAEAVADETIEAAGFGICGG